MPGHPLSPLLAPRSIALVGASARANTPGNDMLHTLRRSGFAGGAYAVNPKYPDVAGYACYPSIADCPEPVDLAVLAVSNEGLDGALAEAVDAGARAAVIFASGQEDPVAGQPLIDRLRGIARSARMPVCGVNCMGFYNDESRVWVCGFPSKREPRDGGITLISQSGSVFGAFAHNDPRFRFNLVVSPGQELVTTLADYVDYALESPKTRVIGLFIETIRDPEGFLKVLEKAQTRRVPMVALKVGRTPASQAMAISHTGALTGDDAAFDAICRRYGVIRVDDLDEMAATLLLLNGRPLGTGGLATIHDSGGEREMLADLAGALNIPFARPAPATLRRIAERLEPGLEPGNPLDAWGTGNGFQAIFTDCLRALHLDDDTAISMLVSDVRDGYYVSEGFVAACEDVAWNSDKPVALVTNFSGVRHDGLANRMADAGIPLLDGTTQALRAVGHAMRHRGSLAREADEPPSVDATVVARWRGRLDSGTRLDEAAALQLLGDFSIAVPRGAVAMSDADLIKAARTLTPPYVLKTAQPDVHHKTDLRGVVVDLQDITALSAAYREMSARLGPRVLVQEMAPKGVELVIGMKRDDQYGPIILIGAGGIMAELNRDIAYYPAPFGPRTAERLLADLKVAHLLAGYRAQAGGNLRRVAEVAARFSAMCAALARQIAEIDVNPLIVGPACEIAVDCLIHPDTPRGEQHGS